MNNPELAKKITDDLFGDAKQLRQFTDFPPNGNYLAGWGKSGAQTRIEHLLAEADMIPRQAVADALAALRDAVMAEIRDGRPVDFIAEDVVGHLDATIAKLGLGAAKESDELPN